MLLDPVLAASGALVLRARPLSRRSLLPRTLGLYIAFAAGTIQLLDIVLDRLALPDRLFVFAIVLAIIGVPIVVTATLFYDVASTDRSGREPESRPVAAPHHRALETDSAELKRNLPARLELALSYRRIAQLHRDSGALAEARSHQLQFARETEQIVAELRALVNEET